MAVPKTLFGQTCRLRVFVSPGVCSRRTTHMRLHPRRKRRHRHCAHVSRRLCRPIWGRTPSSDHVHDPVYLSVRPTESFYIKHYEGKSYLRTKVNLPSSIIFNKEAESTRAHLFSEDVDVVHVNTYVRS